LFLVIIWGISWPMTKLAIHFIPPLLFSGIRTLLGGLLLLIVALPRLERLRLREAWRFYLISSLFNIILYSVLQTIGINYLPSGLFSVLVFLQPVLIGIFSWLWLGESMYVVKIIGLLIGFAGVAIISTGSISGHISFVGIILALCSALSWAVGTVYVKKIGDAVDNIWLVTNQLLIGGVLMTGTGSALESWSSIEWTWTLIWCMLFISVFVIAIGWFVFFTLIGAGEASKVASYTFIIPLVAVVTGTLFLHEPFTPYLLAGLVCIVLSIYLVNRKTLSLKRQDAAIK
jgi:drug/metabolite transporter (DMT)-like permease